MSDKIMINVPLNRVEGDLEIRAKVENGCVTDSWSSGTMYRGFETILKGRGALDGLIITPRICGICNTSHLVAAASALNMINNIKIPPDAVRMINIALMTEHIQSDIRHSFLMFASDFVNPEYKNLSLFDEAVRRYEPLKGETVLEVVRATKKPLEIIALIGGQWPHSSFVVPGGIVSNPDHHDLLKCKMILKQYKKWYEKRILGCSIERWLQVQNLNDLYLWLEENESHYKSDLGFYIRYAQKIGLDKIGKAYDNFISFGAYDIPEDTKIKVLGNSPSFIPAGFTKNSITHTLNQEKISEHVAASWYMDYEEGKHPFHGETKPFASGREGNKYSWSKAPRYQNLPAETGPLADMIMSGSSLFCDIISQHGSSVFVRQLARIVRPALLMPVMEVWISETSKSNKFYIPQGHMADGEGFGLVGAARGALGHWVRIVDSMIDHYQIITPTAWNLSPRDSKGQRGPAEQALIGIEIKDSANPVKLGHIIRSFDVCMVCAVHAIDCT